MFPVLDVIRLAVKLPRNNAEICKRNNGLVIEKLKTYINNNRVPNNTLVALRALSNLCCFETGENVIFDNKFELLENITSLGSTNKNTQVNNNKKRHPSCNTCFRSH